MSYQRQKLKCLTLLTLLVMRSSLVRGEVFMSEEGGYNDVVIRISEDLDMNKCSSIINSLKSLMTAASSSLHTALFGRVWYETVKIVIPSSWPSSVCGVNNDLDQFHTPAAGAQVMVTNGDIYHGYYPHTVQTGGCGDPGDMIMIPHMWLTTNNITTREARQFVHLWSRYRYGVFAETGFSSDPLYPSYYRQDGDIVPTLTHNAELGGGWVSSSGEECDPSMESEECEFVPEVSSGVTCSLGSGLVTTERYCNTSETRVTPTQQSVECGGRSALEVIMSHPDLQRSPLSSGVRSAPVVSVVRMARTRYVLALDTSVSPDTWTWVSKAAHKLIRHDLSLHSHLALLTFNSRVKVEHGMVQVDSDSVRTTLADTIPGRYHLSSGDTGACISCVLSTIIDNVLGGDTAGAHVIIISSPHLPQLQQQRSVSDSLARAPLRVSSIIIPTRDSDVSRDFASVQFFDQLSAQTRGHSFKLAETGYGIDLLVGVNQAFAEILRLSGDVPEEDLEETVSLREHYSNSDDNESSGDFIIDETLGRDTIFGIYVQDEEDHLIKSVTFWDADNHKYGPYTKMSSALDPFNIKTINYVGEEPPFGNAGNLGRAWRYSIKWSMAGSRVSKNIVSVVSRPRSMVSTRVWSHGVRSEQQVTVFASVSLSSSPVLNCTVMMDVELENSNGTVFMLLPTLMSDQGGGGADMVAHDGIYSAVIPSYPSDGRYKISVRISTNELSSTFPPGEISASLSSHCCGSSTRPRSDKLIRPAAFSRTVLGPVLHIVDTDHIPVSPPARVTDLDIVSDNSGVLAASWTNSDPSNTITSFQFVFSSDISDLIMSTAHPQVLRQVDSVKHENTAQLQFSLYGRDYYLGVVAVDSDGQHSRMSNIVHVYQQPPLVEQELLDQASASYDLLQPTSDRDWIMVAVVCAIFLVLLSVTCVMSVYLCWYKHKRSKTVSRSDGSSSDVNVVSSGSSDQTDATSFELDMKNLCPSNETPPPGYDLSITRVPHVPDRDTSPGSRVTPIYWSASQLLSKLDMSDPGHLYYHQQHTAPVIPDEFCVTVSDLHYGEVTRAADLNFSEVRGQHRGHRTYSEDSGLSDCDKMMPPPVYPKPKNITQV